MLKVFNFSSQKFYHLSGKPMVFTEAKPKLVPNSPQHSVHSSKTTYLLGTHTAVFPWGMPVFFNHIAFFSMRQSSHSQKLLRKLVNRTQLLRFPFPSTPTHAQGKGVFLVVNTYYKPSLFLSWLPTSRGADQHFTVQFNWSHGKEISVSSIYLFPNVPKAYRNEFHATHINTCSQLLVCREHVTLVWDSLSNSYHQYI